MRGIKKKGEKSVCLKKKLESHCDLIIDDLLLLEDDTGIDNLEALALLVEHDGVGISLSNLVLKVVDELRDTRHDLTESLNVARLLTTSTLEDGEGLDLRKHLVGSVDRERSHTEGNILENLDEDTTHTVHDGGTEGSIIDRANDDLLAKRSHLLDADTVDVGVSLVLLGVLDDGLEGSADTLVVLDVDLDTASIRLVEDIRGDDLHHNRIADLVGKVKSLLLGASKLSAGNRETVDAEELLGLGLSEAVATVLASTLDDLHSLGLGVLGVREGNELVTLTSLELGDLAESRKGAKSLLGIVVKRDRALGGELLASLLALDATDEASHERLVLLLLRGLVDTTLDGISNLRRLGGGGLAVKNGDSVDPRVVESDLNAILIALITSTTSDIDRVLGTAEGRHALVESILKVLRSGRERNAVELSSIRGKNTDTTTVGDDKSVVTLHRRLHGESLAAVKHLIKVHSTDDLSLIEGSVVDLDSTSKRASVRSSGGGTTSRHTTLKSDDGLASLATSLDELAAVLETLNVQGDAVGVSILSVVVDGIGKVDIAHVTEGDHGAAAEVADEGGTVKSDKKGTRLGNQSGVATVGEGRSEGGVGVAAVEEQTNDVGAKNAAAALLSDLHELFLLSVVANLREARGDDDVALDLLLSSLTSTANDELGGDSVDCKVDLLIRDLGDVLEGREAADGGSGGVDGIHLTLILAVDEVLDDSVADAANLGRSADDGDALRGEDLIHGYD